MADQQLIATLALATLSTVSTPSPTPSSMPVTNLTQYHPGRVCRLLDLTQTGIIFDLTAALAASALTGLSSYRYVIVIGGNLTSAATIEAYTGPTLASVASVITASLHVPPRLYWLTVDNDGARFPMRHTVLDLGSQRTEPFLRVVLSDPTNPAGFLDLGVMFPHPGYVPALPIITKPAFGASEGGGAGATTPVVLTVSGAKHTRPLPVFRQREITFQAVGAGVQEEVQGQWIALQETIGLHDPFACITNMAPTSRYMDHFVYGTLTAMYKVNLPEIWGAGEVTMQYEELR